MLFIHFRHFRRQVFPVWVDSFPSALREMTTPIPCEPIYFVFGWCSESGEDGSAWDNRSLRLKDDRKIEAGP